MKKIIFTAAMTMLSMAGMAQSTDAGYPLGNWQTNVEEGKANYYVSLWIERESKADSDFGNRVGCGYLKIDDNKTDKTVFLGQLVYDGKQLNDKGMPTGVYDFKVYSSDGKVYAIGMNVNAAGGKIIVYGTGALKNHPAFNQPLIGCQMSMHDEDFTMYRDNDKEVLESLREAEASKTNTPGFGNRKQYIAAHAKLDPNKPKYAKPKGASAINIRKTGDAKAAKIGELKPGTTLQVIDEYNGWCQVKIADKQYGWVSLSVVTLTNTPAGTADATDDNSGNAETVCPLVGIWSGILGGGWGDTAVSIKADKKAGNNAMNPDVVCNGNIDMSDDGFVEERTYYLLFNRTISTGVYEFTVQRKVGKQMKSGKMQIKNVGSKIVMTGLDAWAKQQPFHNKSLDKWDN